MKATNTIQSHIGRKAIRISPEIQMSIHPECATFSSPKGKLELPLKSFIKLERLDNKLNIKVSEENDKAQKQMWGTTAALAKNIIAGLTDGFSLPIKMVGVGDKY